MQRGIWREAAQRQAFIDRQHKDVDVYLANRAKLTFGELLAALPRPETPDNQPNIHKAGDGFFLSDNGYSSRQINLPDRWTIRFASDHGTVAAVEEQANASAAAFTRTKGSGHFIIEMQRKIERFNRMLNGPFAGHDVPYGLEAQLTIRIVRSDALPDDLKGAELRIVDAQKVLADFAAAHPKQGT